MLTIFTSCYNQAKHLDKAIESVLTQTYQDFEYLIYDDGSTDNTWEIIQSYAATDSRIVPIRLEKQRNIATVINKSIARAKGDAWVWCPSDDFLYEDLLETKVAAASKEECILYSNWDHIDQDDNILGTVVPPQTFSAFLREVETSSPIGFTGIYIPLSVFKKVGLFPEHIDYSEDFYWMLKSLTCGIKYKCIPKSLYQKRLHDNRLSKRHSLTMKVHTKETREEVKSLSAGSTGAVPKKAVFYWEASRMSFLRYLSIYSFRKYNPDWEIELWTSSGSTKEKVWIDHNVTDDFVYEGEDYFSKLYDLDLSINEYKAPYSEGISPVHKSDLFRWHRLEDGCVFFDTDIFFIKPIEEAYQTFKNCSVGLSYFDYFTIGMLASKGGSPFFKDLYSLASLRIDQGLKDKKLGYQVAGVECIYRILQGWTRYEGKPLANLQFKYPSEIIFNFPKNWIYPFIHTQLQSLFEKEVEIPSETFGLHWYGGSPISQNFNVSITPDNLPPSTLVKAIKELL